MYCRAGVAAWRGGVGAPVQAAAAGLAGRGAGPPP
jgi:hypothetical protein